MTDEQIVVNQEESQSQVASTTTETEQAPIASEGVNTQEADGKDYKAIAENLTKALKAEREKNKQPAAPQVHVGPATEDDTVKRFLQTEANSVIAIKLQTDPTFRDRVELVQEYVAQGYNIDMADKLAMGDIMGKILKGSSEEATQTVIPKQITPTAIPEPTIVARTGNVLDDIEKGLVEVDPELAATIAKYRNKG